MRHPPRVSALATAFLLAAAVVRAQDQPPTGVAPPDPANAVYVTGAGGQTRIPVRIIIPRESLLAISRQGTWSGDTLLTRTPLVLAVDREAARVTFQAVRDGAIRVTLATPPHAMPETFAGSEIRLLQARDRRSLTGRPAGKRP